MHIHDATIAADQTPHEQQHTQDTHHLRKTVSKPDNSPALRLLAESGFSLQKAWRNLNTRSYKRLSRHSWTWRPNTACSKQHTVGFGPIWANPGTAKLYVLQQDIFAWKQLKTLPAQQTGWLPSVENCIARNPAKNAVLSTQKQQPLPKEKEKIFF